MLAHLQPALCSQHNIHVLTALHCLIARAYTTPTSDSMTRCLSLCVSDVVLGQLWVAANCQLGHWHILCVVDMPGHPALWARLGFQTHFSCGACRSALRTPAAAARCSAWTTSCSATAPHPLEPRGVLDWRTRTEQMNIPLYIRYLLGHPAACALFRCAQVLCSGVHGTELGTYKHGCAHYCLGCGYPEPPNASCRPDA